jgi:hypothetical protein
MNSVEDDNVLMDLVDQAMGLSPEKRSEWVRGACGGDAELSARVFEYVDAERQMKGFLQRPFATYFEKAFRTAMQTAESPRTALESEFQDRSFRIGGLLIGRFRIVRRVAEGGMGVVYEASDERLDRRVAIKCAKTGFGNRLPPEVRHAREISHPNVCRIFDIHTAYTAEGEIDFLTMEFLEGQTLAERLRAGPLSVPAARAIANQLCEGVAEAHRRHVVHGDLKSNNVILVAGTTESPERVAITDFGLARPNLAGEAGASSLMGSAPIGGALACMAPELFQGAKPGTASDVYALGVMLGELVRVARTADSRHRIPRRWSAAVARCVAPGSGSAFCRWGRFAQSAASTAYASLGAERCSSCCDRSLRIVGSYFSKSDGAQAESTAGVAAVSVRARGSGLGCPAFPGNRGATGSAQRQFDDQFRFRRRQKPGCP